MALMECNVEQAKAWLEEGDTVFVDIRDPQSYGNGTIPGATRLDDDTLDAFLQVTPKNSRIVVCCYHGNSSKEACRFLSEQGFENAFSLSGGFSAWSLTGPISRGER